MYGRSQCFPIQVSPTLDIYKHSQFFRPSGVTKIFQTFFKNNIFRIGQKFYQSVYLELRFLVLECGRVDIYLPIRHHAGDNYLPIRHHLLKIMIQTKTTKFQNFKLYIISIKNIKNRNFARQAVKVLTTPVPTRPSSLISTK